MKKTSTQRRHGVPGFGPILTVLLLLCGQLLFALPPLITSVSPLTARPLTGSITITGTGFNDTPSRNIVFIGGAQATVTAASLTSITVTVPVGATYSQVSVMNMTTRQMAYSNSYFTPSYNPVPYRPFSRAFRPKLDLDVVGTLHTNAITYQAVTGDIDGDGKVDIIVASYDSFIFARSPIEIYRNNSVGGVTSFAAPVICTASYGARNVRLGDLDNDGKLDIIVASSGSGRISVIRNMSTPGTIDMAPNLNLALTTGAYETAVADFNGDGKLDIAAIGFADGNVQIYRNIIDEIPSAAFTSSGSFTSYHVDFSTGGDGPVSIATADMDADGRPDLVISNYLSDQIAVLKNNTLLDSFMFGTAVMFPASGPQQVVVADMNADGKPDIIVPAFNSGTVNVMQNLAAPGVISSSSFVATNYSSGSGATGVSIGDLDGDGKPDIVVSKFFFDSFAVIHNSTTGPVIGATSFTYDSTYSVGLSYGPLGITVADVDGDTKPDVITANNFNSTISLFESYEIPEAGDINGPDSLCVNATATYTSSHAAEADGYWTVTNGHASISFTAGANDTMATVTGVSAGIDTIIYHVVYLSDTAEVMKVVEIKALADTGDITGPNSVCTGVFINLTNVATGGTWSSSNTAIATVDDTGAVTGVTPGNVTIMYMATSMSCGSLTATHPVTVFQSPDAGTITGPGGTCTGNAITLTASNAGGTWVNLYPAIASHAPSGTTDVVTGVSSGADTILYVMSSPSCGFDTAWHSVGVLNGSDALPIMGDTAVCQGFSTTVYNAAPGGVWTTDNPLVALVNPATGEVTSVGVGTAHITYTVTYSCGTVDTFITFHVWPIPVVTPISNKTVCNGSVLTINLSSSVPGSTFSWTNNDPTIGLAASGTSDPISFTAINTAATSNTASISVVATANGCSSATENFNIIVKPTATLTSTTTPASVCDNTPFTYTSTSNRTGTIYSWSRATVTGISNAAASDTGSISETLHNTTADSVQVVYVDTLNYNGCRTTQNISVYIKPTPTLTTTMNLPICDSAEFTFHPSSPTAGTDYAWIRNTMPGIANTAAFGVDSLAEYLDNTTDTVITVTYIYTLTAAGCTNTQNVTVMVNPSPRLISGTVLGPICDSIPFVYYPTTATPGVTVTWTRDSVGGIMNAAATGADTIGEYLYNTTDTAITVSYLLTLNVGTCSDTQRIWVVVNPRPMLTSVLLPSAICSGDTFNYTPTSNVAGATFSWSRTTVAGISNLPASGTGNPAEILNNTDVVFIDVPYTYTVTALGCSNTQTVTVRVLPKPILSVTADTICSGTPFSYSASSPVGGTTFSWTRASVAGITPDTGSGPGNIISDTLYNNTRFPLNAVYVFTLTAGGCSYTQNFTLRVEPTVTPVPLITTSAPSDVCLNTMYQNFGAASAPVDTQIVYQWSAINATVFATGEDHRYAVVNFTNPGTAWVILSTSIVAANCVSADTVAINVSNSPAPTPTVLYFNKQFVCLPADLDKYQWGYDDMNFDSTVLAGETNQDYINATPDADKYYWVMTWKGDCMQKTYHRTPTGITNINGDDITMKLYPNPTNAMLTVEVSDVVSGNMEIQVYDMVGKLIATQQLMSNKLTYDAGQLAQGTYLVTCYKDGVKVAASRFVKN